MISLRNIRPFFSFLLACVLVISLLPAASQVQAVSPDIVISQVYGGGGNTGAPYKNDFVELFNRSTTAVSLNGLSIQYTSATGTGLFSGSVTVLNNFTLQPGQYYLVKMAGGTTGDNLPTPDQTGTASMSATGGKVALVMSTTGLACNGASTPCTSEQLALIKDLVGWDGANFYETAAAPATTNSTAVIRAGNGCTDSDNNSADFTAATPTPRNTSTTANQCSTPVDTAPSVATTTPANGATDIAVNADIAVTFSEAVDVTGTWFTISCATSGAHTAAVSGGPTTFTLNPDADFANNELCTVTIVAAQVEDQDTNDPPGEMTANYTFSFTTALADVCGLPDTPIGAVQGSGDISPFAGTTVTVQGVVVGDNEGASPALRGFYLQDTGDGDPTTSDGIFIYNGNNNNYVSVGQVVQVTGPVSEYQGQTQITQTVIVQCNATGSIQPTDVTLPLPSATYLERYEGMLVRFPQTLYVTEHYQLGRFGLVVMSADSRLAQPTNVVAPGAPALALQAANNLNRIIVDDDLQSQNPDPIKFGRGGNQLTASNTLRGGDTATGMVGVMTYTWGGNSASPNAYRLRPVNALGGGVPNFQPANARPSSVPDVGGRIKVVGMNLLNYFNTFDGLPDNVDNCSLGVGGGPTDCRGADTQVEFDRQWPKTVAAIAALNADVIGVNEIENDGYGPDSAIQHLVNKLNEALGANTYAFIDVDARTGQVNALGTDAIKVGMIYKPAKVAPVGTTAALNSAAFVNGGDSAPRNRPSLAQAFEEIGTGSRFIVDINHLKSKGSACDIPDALDGQGECNIVRTNAANALTAWLASDPTGTGSKNILIMGDLNSYAMEDPVTAIKNAGYTNLISSQIGPGAYSYVFDGQWGYLDHALGSAAIVPQVSGVAEYHINADEPSVLDYNTDYKTTNLQTLLYAPDQFRISDHDPVIVGLNLGTSDPEILSLSLKQSADKLTWNPVSGSLAGGYAMALNPALEYQYLDVASLVPNKTLKEDYHPFYLDQAALPAGFMEYWAGRGVPGGSDPWMPVMYQIITGAQPMFYLKVGPGPSYMLVDGLQKLIGAGDNPLRISGNYPLGTYTFNGVLTDTIGGSKPLSVTMTFEALPEISALALKQSKDTTAWSPVSGALADGYNMPLDEAVLYYYLNVESLTANKSLKEDYHPFYLDQASLPAGFMAYWEGKGVVPGASGWEGVMYQIITGAQPMFYLKVGPGPSYMLVDGLQKLIGAGDNLLRISGNYPLGTYTFNGVLTDTIGGSKPLSVTMTFTRQQYTLAISVIGSGSVSRSPDKATYDAGEPVKLTATAPAGWKFDGWSGNSTSTSPEITIIMTGDKSYTANFSQIEYTLTIIIQGGGVVNKTPEKTTYHLNDVVTLTADYTWGWSFGGWSGDITSTANSVSVTITGNMTVTATFNPLSPGLEPRIILPLIYNSSSGK